MANVSSHDVPCSQNAPRSHWRWSVVACCLLLSGACTRFDSAGVDVLPVEDCSIEACDSSSALPICDAQELVCRRCVDGDLCPGSDVCNPETGGCEAPTCENPPCSAIACNEHDECASGACQDSICADPAQLLYVDQQHVEADDQGPCDQAQPCMSVTGALQRLADGDERRIVVIRGDDQTPYDAQPVISSIQVQLIGDGAVLQPSQPEEDQPVVTVIDGAEVSISGLTLRGAIGSDGSHGIFCRDSQLALERMLLQGNDGTGVDAQGCALSVQRSYLTGNIRGGIRVQESSFVIRNNIVIANGHEQFGTFGGVHLVNNTPEASQVLEFNTIVGNISLTAGMRAAGLTCVLESRATNLYNIIQLNQGPLMADLDNCALSHSNIDQMLPDGVGNIDMVPSFANPIQGDLHLQADSPGIDVLDGAEPACGNQCVDIDGQPRPMDAGYDMGADEYSPADSMP